MIAAAERFERLYHESPDPWGYRTSAYEREKYAATLAALPQHHHGRCLEIGCSIGVFTRLLAARCAHVVAIDFSLGALELARRELQEVENVELRHASFPEQVPRGPWDLIVCSEILYYLQKPALDEALVWLAAQLADGAGVIAVSWRGVGREEPMLGDEVHNRLALELGSWHTLDARCDGYRLDRFEGR